jgi:hypothetical protein
MPALFGRKMVTIAVINPPIPPMAIHGITADIPASGVTALKNLFHVNTAAAITSNSDKAVLFIVPLMVITSEEAVVYSLLKTFSLKAGFELFVKFIMAVKIKF